MKMTLLVGVAMVTVAAGLPTLPTAKPGLYEVRKTSNMAMFIAYNLSKSPAAEQQKMSTESLAHPGPVFQLCVPQDGAKLLNAVAGMRPDCTYSNVVTAEGGFSADASCGKAPSMHITFEAKTPEHRESTLTAPMQNAAVPLVEKYEANWISANCGDIPPGSMRTPV